MENKNKRVGVLDIVFLVLSILFFIGSITLFKPCDPMDDGSWMTCHWAGVVVTALSGVLIVISVIHIIVADSKIKTGLSIAAIPVSVMAAIVPGILIHLCMMNTMRCHTTTRPAAIVFSIIIIIIAVVDVIKNRRNSN